MQELVSDLVSEWRAPTKLLFQIRNSFELASGGACLFLCEGWAKGFVHFRLDAKDHQAGTIPANSHDVRLRDSFATGKGNLPLGNGKEQPPVPM